MSVSMVRKDPNHSYPWTQTTILFYTNSSSVSWMQIIADINMNVEKGEKGATYAKAL